MRGQQTDPKCVCRGVSYQESNLSENWKPKTGGGEIFLLIRGRAQQRESNQTILLMIRYHCKLVKSILFLTKQSFYKTISHPHAEYEFCEPNHKNTLSPSGS